MLRDLKFRSKILFLPVSFAIAFIVVLLMVQFYNNKNAKTVGWLIKDIKASTIKYLYI